MPATESIWRNQKLMHVVFGASSVAMLLTTIWMLTADHRREWKTYQGTFLRDVETWSAKARLSAQENDPQFLAELKKREDALHAAQEVVPPKQLLERFEQAVEIDAERRKEKVPDVRKLDSLYSQVETADETSRPTFRGELVGMLNDYVAKAKFREVNALAAKKFKAADFDVARSEFELGVGNGMAQAKLDEIQKHVDKIKGELDELTNAVQDATLHRKNLERILGEMTADESIAQKALDDQKGAVKRLQDAVYEKENSVAKEVLAAPIIDAFGRPLKIEQIWLPKLTQFNNFRDVPRFDRCITCHQGIEKTAPGSAVEPGYPHEQVIPVALPTPASQPQFVFEEGDSEREKIEKRLEQLYGITLEDHGLLNEDDPTVKIVRADSPAAKAGLLVGDVIAEIGGTPAVDKRRALAFMTEVSTWGAPISLKVRRGLPSPYASHPRLDLFVGSMSPHKLQTVGCTICHEGQGTATAFKYASHMPDDPMQAEEWKRKYGWFNNHHWIFPMPPTRNAEGTCLKCHYELEELEPSERFPEPPAPKLVEGYNLIRTYGCFGCHEINGYDGPTKRQGPDLRSEPNYAMAAKALLPSKELSDDERSWAEQVVARPDDSKVRRLLFQSINNASKPNPDSGEARISKDVLKLAQVLDDVEVPGKLRKVGPSLRHVASKNDWNWMYSWVANPTDFRPDTKMPRFFGLHDHLADESAKQTKEFEDIEVRGILAYLQTKSMPFAFASPEKGIEQPSADRGKKLFQTRGCLACHQHSDFPTAKMNQGPNLSNVGAKFNPDTNKNGPDWLYTWLKNPNQYHPRTLMPNLILEPIKQGDGKTTDPAADIVEFLLGSNPAWKPNNVPPAELSSEEQKSLHDLAFEYIKTAFPTRLAEKYLDKGIPEDRRWELKGDEVELIGPMSQDKQLVYVGRRAISKYGCSGCHDVPGFEDAKPIGTGLADWGRKGADKLAFEQISTYLSHGHGHSAADKAEAEAMHSMKFTDLPPNIGYFMEKLAGHEREGFIWQKLREPRSYDYEKIANKGYNERLRMPQFNLTEDQREAIICFVLGLVAEPPVSQYIYHPTPEREAIVQGKKVLEKYNCGGCHTLKMEEWKLGYTEDQFGEASEFPDYGFLKTPLTPEQVRQSVATDFRGLRHATLHGMPVLSEESGKPIRYDEDGVPIEPGDTATPGSYSFVLWKDAVINGQQRPAGLQNLLVPEKTVEQKFDAFGGYLARLLYPAVFAAEKELNPNAKPEETWAYLPPPLVGEGRKVQSNWLHSFLLDPHPIRPAVILRMPRFNMSSDEATKLVNYFAAVDGAKYPYDYDPRTSESHLEMADKEHPGRFGDALKIVADGNYCVKCHLVGDYAPPGSDRAKGPQLEAVYDRLRPDYLRAWVANPKRILPYTAMPVNIPFDKPVNQALYKGDSVDQLDALVDLLLNFDRYAESKTSIKPLVKPAAPASAAAEK